MNTFEVIAITLSLTGLFLLGSGNPKRRLLGFVVNAIASATWMWGLPFLSVIIVNCMFICANLYNIYCVAMEIYGNKNQVRWKC